MEINEIKKIMVKIKDDTTLLYALEKLLDEQGLLEETYQSLHYQIEDLGIKYEINFYEDTKTGKWYSKHEVTNEDTLSLAKKTIYNVKQIESLMFRDYVISSEEKIKSIPDDCYKENKETLNLPLLSSNDVTDSNLANLMHKYPGLFIFLVAHYNIDIDTLKDISNKRHVYKKEIKKN